MSQGGGKSGDALLDAALEYLALRWSVIPVLARGKRPLVPWTEHQARRADEAQIRAWLARWPAVNLGVVTGAVSGLVVLDIDPPHGGEDSVAGLEAEHGQLPRTVEALTGSGGRHLYFRHPGGEVHNQVGLAPGVDLRGDGGMIVVPPSIHPSGGQYRWVEGSAPGDVPLAPLPGWLLDRIAARAEHKGHPLTHWRTLVKEGVGEGRRNNTIASFAGHLLWHGVDPLVALELLLTWNRERCRPPLDDDEVARTVESIRKLHERERGDGASG